MVWIPPWRRRRLQVRFPICISVGGIIGGGAVLAVRWLYIHPSNPAVGSALSVMADFVPMAIAVVGIVMSYRTPKKEHHLRTTLILITCGFVGTGIMSLVRMRGEATHRLEVDGLNTKLQSVADQNGQILKGITEPRGAPPPVITQAPQPTEAGRRKSVLALLRNEYILSHDKVSPGLIAGIEPLPSEWVNSRLRELGEKWIVSSPERQDAGMYFVHPEDPAVIVYNRSNVILKDPRYSVIIWDLDGGKKDSLPTYSQPFKDQWLRRTGESASAFGPWRIFETLSTPPKGQRLFGYSRVTCPDCIIERFYWIYTRYGEKEGWYGELPDGLAPDLKFIISLFDQSVAQQESSIINVQIKERLPIKAS
jgi:hypothetical protein